MEDRVAMVVRISGVDVKDVTIIGGDGVNSLVLLAESKYGAILRIDWFHGYYTRDWPCVWKPETVTVTVL